MKLLYRFLTMPTYYIGSLFLIFNLFGFRDKLLKCTRVVDAKCDGIPKSFIGYLISAEDHRSLLHCGIDHVGMLRAMYKKISNKETLGASTIEQQFVRVVTGDYSRSIIRKVREQILATHLSKQRNKIDIAKAYLAIAYYGHKCFGFDGISMLIGMELEFASEKQIITLIAQLKYPKPEVCSKKWEEKISNRIGYIHARHEKAINKSRQRMLRSVA